MSDVDGGGFEANVEIGIEPINEGMLASEEDRNALTDYLSEEIEGVLGGAEREDMVKKWEEWRRISEARPKEETKDYPWPNASNVTVPLTMTNTNGLYSLLKATYGMKKPFWTIESTSNQHSVAKAISKTLEFLADSPSHLDIRRTNNTIFYDLIRLGTQFVKVPWITDAYTFKRSGEGGAEEVTRVRRNSPVVVPMRIEDALTRPYWIDPQRSPWFGHHVHLMKHDLLQRQQQGIFVPEEVEKVLEADSTKFDENYLEELRRRGIDPAAGDTEVRSIVEAYVFWDIDGDGIPEDVLIWFHPETKAILRVEYNDLGIRPIVRMPYINIPHQLYGIGTGWMCSPLQNEVDALHNMRINAEHLHSLQMYVTKTGSRIGGQMEFRPLKKIEVDDPSRDFLPVQFPGVGYENLQSEMFAKEYADRATGMSDYMMGFENQSIGTRSTFAGTAFLAQQGNRIFDAMTENVNDAYGEIGQITLFQLVRNREKVRKSILPMLDEETAMMMDQVLEMEVEDIPTLFRFHVETTDSEKTEQVKTQQKMMLFQLYSTYGEKLLQLMQLGYAPPQSQIPPEMRKAAQRLMVGSTRMLDDILKTFDVQDTKDYLHYVEDIDLMLDMMTRMKESQVAEIRNNIGDGSRTPSLGAGNQSGGVRPVGGPSQQQGMGVPQGGGV